MNLRTFRQGLALLALGAVLAGCSGSGGGAVGVTSVSGETATIGSSNLTTEATYQTGSTQLGTVQFVVPMDVINNPPSTPGSGNAGAIAMADLPTIVQNNSFFNHVELHWNPNGHPPARYMVPHFDIHFYNSTKAQVGAITNPDTAVPDANRVPFGYTYMSVNDTVPQMGTHVLSNAEMAASGTFSYTMVMLYYGGKLIGVEPMIRQDILQGHQLVLMSVPRPPVVGQVTEYPTKFVAAYDASIDSYRFTFSNFVTTAG